MESIFTIYSTLTEIQRIQNSPELSKEINISSYEWIGKNDPEDYEEISAKDWEEGDYDHKRMLWTVRLIHEPFLSFLPEHFEDWSDVRLSLLNLREGGALNVSFNYTYCR